MGKGLQSRLELDAILRRILRESAGQRAGEENCYFDPPENFKIKYPCIIYEKSNNRKVYADNNPYGYTRRYSVTIIDTDPDSEIPDHVEWLPMSTHDRDFVTDNLHHYIFSIYH